MPWGWQLQKNMLTFCRQSCLHERQECQKTAPNNNVNATECRYWEEGYAGYSAITDDTLREIIAKDPETNKIKITVAQYEKTKKTWKHG